MDPAAASCIWLTSLRVDGSPHTVPVWFVLDEADDAPTVWVGTSVSTAKIRNLRHDPRVSMAIDRTGSSPWVAEGRAVIHEPFDHDRWAGLLARFAAKYDGWDAADTEVFGPRALVEIPVTRWLLGGPDAPG